MAWIFSLSAECGAQEEAAEAVTEHFRGLTVTLADGSHFPCEVGTHFDGEGWWAGVCPTGVSRSGIGNEQDRRQMTEIGFALYERLRTAPPYRYALVGVEVGEFRSFRELDDDLVKLDFSGLVLADAVWHHVGSPSIYVPFTPGYRWRPFTQAR
jgi:hypothetical protein